MHKGRRTGQMVEEIILPRRRANKSQPVTLRHFSHWPRRIGSVGRYRKLKSEGKKRRERVVGKAAGDECVFIGEAEPFGATITHHRMPPNTVTARVAWPARYTPVRHARL